MWYIILKKISKLAWYMDSNEVSCNDHIKIITEKWLPEILWNGGWQIKEEYFGIVLFGITNLECFRGSFGRKEMTGSSKIRWILSITFVTLYGTHRAFCNYSSFVINLDWRASKHLIPPLCHGDTYTMVFRLFWLFWFIISLSFLIPKRKNIYHWNTIVHPNI